MGAAGWLGLSLCQKNKDRSWVDSTIPGGTIPDGTECYRAGQAPPPSPPHQPWGVVQSKRPAGLLRGLTHSSGYLNLTQLAWGSPLCSPRGPGLPLPRH